jgi:adhesin transport system membrane fusion protein
MADNDSPGIIQGSRRKRLLSEAIQLDEEVVPAFVRPALIVMAVLVVAFIGWSAVVDINEVAVAQGEVVPSSSIQVVEHLEGGVVGEILVAEGDMVEAGQTVVRIKGGGVAAEVNQLKARLTSLRLRAERLNAFVDDRDPDFDAIGGDYPDLIADQWRILQDQIETRRTGRAVIQQQLEQRRRELAQLRESLRTARQQVILTGELLDMRQKMVDKKLIAKTVFLETKRAKLTADGEVARLKDEIRVFESSLHETEERLADFDANLREQATAEIGEVSAEIAEVRNSIMRVQDRQQRLDVTAPVQGLVQGLEVKTVGQVIEPGGLLMRIVPVDETLQAEVRIATKDIGHVAVGQDVKVKVSSYEYTRFGAVPGLLSKVAATSTLDEQTDQTYFKGWVALNQTYVGDEPGRYVVVPGMSVQADIQTGEKTLLDYLLKPLTDALNRAFRER